MDIPRLALLIPFGMCCTIGVMIGMLASALGDPSPSLVGFMIAAAWVLGTLLAIFNRQSTWHMSMYAFYAASLALGLALPGALVLSIAALVAAIPLVLFSLYHWTVGVLDMTDFKIEHLDLGI